MPHRPGAALRAPSDSGADATSLTLIDRVKARHDDAWRRLIALYTPLLRHWCRRWGVGREDADDIIQDVFQAVLTGLEGFRRDRPGDSFRSWLRGVTRHKILSHFRLRGDLGQGGTDSYRRSLLIPDLGDSEPDESERPLLGALYREALGLVRGEFEEKTWQAFWRTAAETRSPASVAADLGTTPAAVRQAKSRVLRRLKEVLGETTRPQDPAADGPGHG
jgi:RNA polymerase sigma-70 factor (ECF subfamily)